MDNVNDILELLYMSDIIPLEVPRWATLRVYILQVIIWIGYKL
jgi:hypothetical protein